MKPSYPWLAPLALLTLTGVACAPDTKVKPGAPVLLSIAIMDATGAGTEISGGAVICPPAVGAGGNCDPAMDKQCRLGMSTWCSCAADAMDMTKGTWACDPVPPMSSIVAIFDRLLDGKPLEFDADAGAGPVGIASLVVQPAMPLDSVVAYTPNGDTVGLVFGNRGPRVTITASPTLPSGSTVTLTLDKNKIRAKDGKTGFTGGDLVKDGIISFMTAPLSATITVAEFDPDAGTTPEPDAGVADAGAEGGADTGGDGGVSTDAPVDMAVAEVSAPDVAAPEAGASEGGAADAPAPVMPGNQAVTVTFNNATDPMMIPMHIKVTVNGTTFENVMIAPPDGMQPGYTITPKTKWPANATITITVDANAADVLGVKLGSPASATFVTGP